MAGLESAYPRTTGNGGCGNRGRTLYRNLQAHRQEHGHPGLPCVENARRQSYEFPSVSRHRASAGDHGETSHGGITQECAVLRPRFYSPGMLSEADTWVSRNLCFEKREEPALSDSTLNSSLKPKTGLDGPTACPQLM